MAERCPCQKYTVKQALKRKHKCLAHITVGVGVDDPVPTERDRGRGEEMHKTKDKKLVCLKGYGVFLPRLVSEEACVACAPYRAALERLNGGGK